MHIRYYPAIIICLLCSTLLVGCADLYVEPLPPRDRINYPIGLALHPNGQFLYAVNSNFDTRYRAELGGTVSVIDTDTLEIQAESSPFIPSFGGYIALNDAATHAYVTTREDDQVAVFNLAEQGQALFCVQNDGTASSNPENCLLDRIPDERQGARVGSDPYGIDVTTIERTNPDSGEVIEIDLINLSYLRGSQVTTIAIPDNMLSAATMHSVSLVAGGNQVIRRPNSMDYYIAGRATNRIGIYQPYINTIGQLEAIVERGNITLNQAISAVDARALTFDPTGRRLFAITRQPSMLYIIGYEPTNSSAGFAAQHQIIQSVPLALRPSDVVLHRSPSGQQRLYITSSNDKLIQVFDPESGALVDTIELDAQPYQLITNQNTPPCRNASDGCRAYVSLFDDSPEPGVRCSDLETTCGAIGVIDLNPESDTYHQLIEKIR